MALNLNDYSHESRTLIWSQRNIENFFFNSCLFEFEDIINEIDTADIVAPAQYNFSGKVTKKVIQNTTPYISFMAKCSPYSKPIYLEKEYDIFLSILDFPRNFSSINLLKNRQEKCQISICYLIEIWRKYLSKLKNFIKFFQEFDLICLGHFEIVDDVQKILNRPCIHLPPGVNALKFCPDLYDYLNDAEQRTHHYQEHRTLISNLLKNSRYFITNYAKINQRQETLGQSEIGYRFFEGAAAGSILLGCPPTNLAFKHYFDWDNAIIPMKFDEPNIVKIIAELDSQPELLKQIQTDNIVNSLLRHDWVYRWEQVLGVLNISLPLGMEKRKQRLAELALAYSKGIAKSLTSL